MFISKPWILKLRDNIRIGVPKGGAGALIFYQGLSEPENIKFILRFLKPGMVFWDIGAHIGEFSLLAARAVGEKGEVHAFEPNPENFDLLSYNIQMNNLKNKNMLNPLIVFGTDDELYFEIFQEPSISCVRPDSLVPATTPTKRIRVPSVRLDDYYFKQGRRVDLIKIDTEGSELSVLRGMRQLLSLAPKEASVLVFECLPINYNRFGYNSSDLLSFLRGFHYTIQCYQDGYLCLLGLEDRIKTTENNLVASKVPICLKRK